MLFVERGFSDSGDGCSCTCCGCSKRCCGIWSLERERRRVEEGDFGLLMGEVAGVVLVL